MSELSLSNQDAEILAEALKLLSYRVEGRSDLQGQQEAIQSLLERVNLTFDTRRLDSIAAITKSLSEIAAELKSPESDTSA